MLRNRQILLARYAPATKAAPRCEERYTFFFVQVIRLFFYPVDMQSKYNMVKTGQVKYS
jgi:hypothetical protein